MTYGPRKIPWASEAREEAWLEWAGEQAKDAIGEALKTWTPDELDAALDYADLLERPGAVSMDDSAVSIVRNLQTMVGTLLLLAPEDAIKVCDKMNLPGEWEYSDDWDPRSL